MSTELSMFCKVSLITCRTEDSSNFTGGVDLVAKDDGESCCQWWYWFLLFLLKRCLPLPLPGVGRIPPEGRVGRTHYWRAVLIVSVVMVMLVGRPSHVCQLFVYNLKSLSLLICARRAGGGLARAGPEGRRPRVPLRLAARRRRVRASGGPRGTPRHERACQRHQQAVGGAVHRNRAMG